MFLGRDGACKPCPLFQLSERKWSQLWAKHSKRVRRTVRFQLVWSLAVVLVVVELLRVRHPIREKKMVFSKSVTDLQVLKLDFLHVKYKDHFTCLPFSHKAFLSKRSWSYIITIRTLLSPRRALYRGEPQNLLKSSILHRGKNLELIRVSELIYRRRALDFSNPQSQHTSQSWKFLQVPEPMGSRTPKPGPVPCVSGSRTWLSVSVSRGSSSSTQKQDLVPRCSGFRTTKYRFQFWFSVPVPIPGLYGQNFSKS